MRREASSRQFGGGGGCTDPFSVFTFLAFALAVMDLLMEMSRCLVATNIIATNIIANYWKSQEEEKTRHRFCRMHGSVTRGGTGGGKSEYWLCGERKLVKSAFEV